MICQTVRFLFLPEIQELSLIHILSKDRLKGIRYLATGAEVPVSTSWVHSDYPDIVFADLGLDPVLPDQTDTVLDVILTEE